MGCSDRYIGEKYFMNHFAKDKASLEDTIWLALCMKYKCKTFPYSRSEMMSHGHWRFFEHSQNL